MGLNLFKNFKTIFKLILLTLLIGITFITLTPFILIQIGLSFSIMTFGFLNNINMEYSTSLYNLQLKIILSLLTNILETS